MKTILKRVISLMLCFVLVAGYLPVGAFAAESGETVTTEATVETTEPTQEASEESDAPSESTEVTVSDVIATTEGETASNDGIMLADLEDELDTAAEDGVNDETGTDYLFIATDRHADTSIIGTLINAMEDDIGLNELDYLALGGDMVGSGSSHPSYNSSTVLGEVTGATTSLSATNVDIVAGIHDMNVTDDSGIVLKYQSGGAEIFEGKYFYIYGVEESCIAEEFSESHWSEQAQAFVDWATGDDIDQTKPIIVVSHYPLHQKRGDNLGGYVWHQALNEVATGSTTGTDAVRNVLFFHGHNHTEDKTEYLYNVGDTMTLQKSSGTASDTIYYTYATAGYLSKDVGNGQASLVTINAESIILTKYSSSSAEKLTTVARIAPAVAKTLSSIAVTTQPTTTTYTVGDTFSADGLVVTATYSDGTTAEVDGYTLSDVDMTTAGTKTVTVAYEGKTATFAITVNEAVTEPTRNTVNCWDDTEQVIVEATALGLTGITAINVTGENEKYDEVFTTDGHMAFDIALEGHTDGNSVDYSISVVADLDVTNLELYYVDAEGNLIPVEFELVEDDLNNLYVEFTTTYVGTFVYGSAAVPEGYTLTSLVLANIPTDVFVGTSVDMTGDAEITATYTMEGAEDFVRKLTIYDYDSETAFSGYDVNVLGKQTVTFTFEGMDAYYDINVWGDEFTTNDVTVHVGESDYGVTGVSVGESTNEHVADAIQYVISGTNYVAYDIELTFETGYAETETTKTVTLPIPSGVTNPVVYYVSDSGKAVNMNATDNGDGTVSFETTHFSTYVLGDGTTIETESGDATVDGTEDVTTTTKVAQEVTVYKLVDTPVSGKQYLIVNSNNGTGYGLDGDTTGYATTAFTGGSDYYSTWDDTSKTGTTFKAGSDVYLTTSGAYLWTVGGSYTFVNGSNYLGYSQSSDGSFLNGGTYSYTVDPTASSTTWTLNGANLYIYLESSYQGIFGGSSESANYYLSGGSTWSMSTTAANVYFYEPDTIYKVTEQEVTNPGTEGGVYSVEGTDITDAVALPGQTATLTSVLYWTPEGGTATDVTASSGLTPTYEVVTTKGNPNVISSISGNVATLAGVEGTAVVKVTYTSGDLTAWDEFIVTANAISDELYTIDLTDGEPNFNSITEPITIKGIQAGMQSSVWAVVKADGNDLGNLGDKLSWAVSDTSIANINTTTGVITFTGKEGTVDVTVYYTCPGGRVIQDTVTYSVTVGNYTVPEDGTDDFPEYPDEGAIRFDKHATAVGTFSETGIVQVELSMTGVPYSTGSEIDVVVMLDMTGSMSDNGMIAAEEATVAFVKKIVQNTDGTYNKNRVAVYAFNSGDSSPYELVSLGTIDSDSELETANTAIRTASTKQTSGGTPFDEAAAKCQSVLNEAKTTNLPEGVASAADYDRQQFCVFMSDGGPTTYEGSDGYTYYGGNASGDRKITSYIGGYSSSSADSWTYSLPTEYYTDQMKKDGVTVYTVGLLLQTAPSNPSPYSSMTDSTYDSTTESLTTIGSHYYFTSTILKNMATDSTKYIDIFDVDNASKATAAFEAIAMSILEAATDVKVTDKITEDYTMVFDAPNSTVADALPSGQEMYIEVKDYTLVPVYSQVSITGFTAGNTYYTKNTDGTYTKATSYSAGTTYYMITDYQRSTSTSLVKLYLGKNGSTYYAASDAKGTAYATPTFNQTAIGTMYYWTTTANTTSGVSVTVDSTTYYFVAEGISNEDDDYVAANWFNMASGAYASGNITTTDIIDSDTNEVIGQNSTCNDLIIATPYFVYNAKTKMLTWTAEKLSTTELALSYFLYLDNSGGYSGAKDETPAGTYETNEYAYLSYTNFNGTDCQQTMPVPQMTWNGAQVSYVFYLVNEAGLPVNRAGRVVPFSEAVYVTDVYTYSIVWNDLEQVASLEANYLASDLVPDVYELYDSGATYDIHVFEDENEQNLNNHFVIGSAETTYTTYVFNSKSDVTKYKTPATYAATSTYMCKEYVEGGEFTDDKGAYNIVTKTGATIVETGFDFSNTTVAFAVVWKPELVEDTVIVDYGLDVVINVTTNDAMASGVVGVRADAPANIEMNKGEYTSAKVTSADVYIDANSDTEGLKELKIGTATVENLTSVRFSLDKTNGMQFNKPASFYYESDVNYYVGTELKTTSMYSKVTVIPATTVYYEDSFLTLTGSGTTWNEGSSTSATQAVDRPGVNKISAAYDADNVYGYDAAYKTMSTHSMGSAASVHVDANSYATASFSFYGTGFDVISMTSNATGMLAVEVKDADGNSLKREIVDTYYGYAYGEYTDGEGNKQTGWHTVESNSPNALYQVPVIKITDLTYGLYSVTLTATYNSYFDHTSADGYDLYLDAVRIYNPAGKDDKDMETDVKNAYLKDGEYSPSYFELRNLLISKGTFDALTTDSVTGAVFIDGANTTGADATDSIVDYVSYGPNNEVYLEPGQAVSFKLEATAKSGYKPVVRIAVKTVKGEGSIKIYDGNTTALADATAMTINTATDMYYDITAMNGKNVVIYNADDAQILSITNVKVSYEVDETSAVSVASVEDEEIGATAFTVSRSSANAAVMSMRPAVVDETEPETTVPETTEPEVTEPETTAPETTEPEFTEPEVTEPEEEESDSVVETITNIVNSIVNAISNFFSKWFR